MFCEFIKVESTLVCKTCGAVTRYREGNVRRKCGNEQVEPVYRSPEPPIFQTGGLGTILKNALTKFGITEDRVSKIIGGPCGCGERAKKLDALTQWAINAIRGKTNETETYNQFREFEKIAIVESATMKWAYGITTVPERLETVFPQTLESLRLAGFDQPRLFVDGENDCSKYSKFGLEVTLRYPRVKTAANWVLSIVELYLREPSADRYAIFQDDFVTYRNLRQYLDTRGYPDEKGYCNLYTFPQNQQLATAGHKGWFESNQKGKGAVALVFSNEALIALLHQTHLIERPKSVRGDRAIDGGIVSAMKKAGYKEYVHSPSLVQHTGLVSSMGNPKHPLAPAFEGEGFDAMKLL